MIVTQEIRNEIIQLYDNVPKKHYGNSRAFTPIPV